MALNANSYSEEEIVIEWDYSRLLETPFVYVNGIVLVNVTLLPISNSNISLTFVDDERITWTPIAPDDFTLNQGESYSQTFTLFSSAVGGQGNIPFMCSVIKENSTATIRFGYNVLNNGTNLVKMPYGIISLIYLLVSSSMLMKRKTKHK